MKLFEHCLKVGFEYVEFICTQWLWMFLLIGLFLCVGCARHLCAQHWHKSRCKQTIENMKQCRKLIRRDKQIIHLIVFWWYLFRVGRIFSLIRFFGSFQVGITVAIELTVHIGKSHLKTNILNVVFTLNAVRKVWLGSTWDRNVYKWKSLSVLLNSSHINRWAPSHSQSKLHHWNKVARIFKLLYDISAVSLHLPNWIIFPIRPSIKTYGKQI